MSVDTRLSKLARLLDKQTGKGALKWSVDVNGKYVFVAINDLVIEVHKSFDPFRHAPGQADYSMIISDGEIEVDRADALELSRGDPSKPSEYYNKILGIVFEQARRQGLGVNEALDSLLETLEEDGS